MMDEINPALLKSIDSDTWEKILHQYGLIK